MLKLDITENSTILIDNANSGYYHLGTTECALGNIIAMLETEFPDKWDKPLEDQIYEHVNNLLNVRNKSIRIWGFKENGSIVMFVRDLLECDFEGKDKISLDMKTVEEIRIRHRIKTNYFPRNILDYSEGAEFSVNTINDVIFGLLYYYALNDLKLVKCEHCGRWFATKTLKTKYCSRKSTFKGYEHLECEQAVRNILQEIGREKKRVYNAIITYETDANKFLVEWYKYQEKVKQRSTVDNLSECLRFLKEYRKRNKEEQANGTHLTPTE